jgi:hypothetical protein
MSPFLSEILSRIGLHDIIIDVIPLSDVYHPTTVPPAMVLVKCVGMNSCVVIPIDCYDTSIRISKSEVELFFRQIRGKIYCFSKKKILHQLQINNLYDLSLKMFLKSGEIIDECEYDTSCHTFFKNQYGLHKEINKIIPHTSHLSKFLDICKDIEPSIKYDTEDSYIRINNDVLETFQKIESHGLAVDFEEFSLHFNDKTHLVHNNLVYTEYNVLTSTGRPSNRFGSINYSALNKENGCRKSFVSRYGADGLLMMLDYSAYHPHIIARLINYNFPPGTNVYHYLGKYYFGSEDLSEDQEKMSKTLTFQQLYGSISEEYLEIPYFAKIREYMNHRWKYFDEYGYVETPIFKRMISPSHIKDASPSKLFNYILQASETEYSVEILMELNKFLENRLTKCVLYTYDSVLFDVHKDDGKQIILEIKKLMESTGFLTKCYIGKNYNNMQRLTI